MSLEKKDEARTERRTRQGRGEALRTTINKQWRRLADTSRYR